MCGEAKTPPSSASFNLFPIFNLFFFFVTQAAINADLKILANIKNSTMAFFVEIQTRVEQQPCSHIPNLINSGKAAGKSWFLSIPGRITGNPALNIKAMQPGGALHSIPAAILCRDGLCPKSLCPCQQQQSPVTHTEHKQAQAAQKRNISLGNPGGSTIYKAGKELWDVSPGRALQGQRLQHLPGQLLLLGQRWHRAGSAAKW